MMNAAYYAGQRRFTLGDAPAREPGANEVRVKVAYCGICGTDLHIFHGKMDARVKTPQIIGHEMSGTVDAVGAAVRHFQPGDKVVVRPLGYRDTAADWGREGAHIRPGLQFLGIDSEGAFQEYWNVPAETLHKLPQALALDLAALCEPLAVACHDVRLAGVKPGEQVVILGGGPIGILIALVARQAGGKVLVSEINPARLQLLTQLGVDTVNPQQADLEAVVSARTHGMGAEVVFEVTASKAGAETMTKLPGIRGRIVLVGIFSEPVPVNLFPFFWKEVRLLGARVYEPEDFEAAIGLMAADALPLRPLISRITPLPEISAAFAEIAAGANIVKSLIQCF